MPADLSTYHSERSALIQADRALRVDHIRAANFTDIQIKADKVVRAIRAVEASSIWSAEYESIPHPCPGMEFLTGKKIIEKTQLYKLLLKMPKGALLHAHLDATVDAATVLKMASEQPAMHIRASQAIHSSNLKSILPEFRPLPEDQFSDISSLTDPSYPLNEWVSFEKARESFDPALGGPEGFDRWVLSALTIDPTEAYGTHNTITKIWQKFSSTFFASTGIIRFAPVWENYIREFFWVSIKDGISYIEARINFVHKFMYRADGNENVPHREWILIFEKVLNEVKEELKRQGREDEFIGARIIYTTLRFVEPKNLDWYTEDCIALKQEFPHLIAGFDIVGNENVLRPLIDYVEPLLRFRKRVDDLGLDIPFILHAGETLGDGTEADMNMYDAILLGTKRIGHGFSLVKHPKLMQICREKGILLEVCPISNEVLRLTSSMPMHPLPILLNHGVSVALCSDDPGAWGSTGLSFDFYQVLASSELTGLNTLGEIARDSLNYSTLGREDKERAIASWQNRWNKFIEEVALMHVV